MSEQTLTSLLDIRDVRVLESLRLKPRKSFTGRVRGERLARQKGVSLEFKDYRDYSDGDDLRHLDWNVLARLGTPIVKTYQDEEDLPVYLLVDSTVSMDYGDPSKLLMAKKLAAAFAVVAGRGGDSVQGISLADSPNRTRFLRGRRGVVTLMGWLDSLRAKGEHPVAFHLKQSAKAMGRTGLAVVLTDGMDQHLGPALGQLSAAGHEVWLVQVLSPFEIDPGIEGDLRLIDAESGEAVEITANGPTMDAYRKNLATHNEALKQSVLRYGGRYELVPSDMAVSKIFSDLFQKAGWLE